MENEVWLIDKILELANVKPPICSLDKPFEAEVLGKKGTVYCKPFEQFQDILRQFADVIGVWVSAFIRLGEFGKLFVDYKGDPRGHMGRAGDLPIEDQVFLMGTLVDVDGGRWVPVQEDLLMELVEKAKAADVAPVRHGRWIEPTRLYYGAKQYECSICYSDTFWKKHSITEKYTFCPNCGAKMDGGADKV